MQHTRILSHVFIHTHHNVLHTSIRLGSLPSAADSEGQKLVTPAGWGGLQHTWPQCQAGQAVGAGRPLLFPQARFFQRPGWSPHPLGLPGRVVIWGCPKDWEAEPTWTVGQGRGALCTPPCSLRSCPSPSATPQHRKGVLRIWKLSPTRLRWNRSLDEIQGPRHCGVWQIEGRHAPQSVPPQGPTPPA